jgi:hypothetical protein
MNGGSLTVTSTTNVFYANAISGADSNYEFTMNGGSVNLKSCYSNNDNNNPSNGISSFKKVTINGGSLSIDTKSDHAEASGFDNCNIIEIRGGTIEVTASANKSFGIIAKDKLIITGGRVSAKATTSAALVGPNVTDVNKLVVAAPMTVVKPAGGGVGVAYIDRHDGQGDHVVIATAPNGSIPATEIVIERSEPEPVRPAPYYRTKANDTGMTEETSSKPVQINKDAIFVLSSPGLPYGTFFAKQEQGAAAKAAFAATLPAGYKQTFTFNMITNGKSPDYSLKKGTFTLSIPPEFLKAGRTYALRVIDKSGNVILLPDADNKPDTITVSVNVEGYAFDLIYKD